jgi:tetratricopeptide (TPR) repeat protein
MKNHLRRFPILSVASLVMLTAVELVGQNQPLTFANITPLSDSGRVAWLHQNGVKLTASDVEAWFPKDSLSLERMRAIVDTLNLGIRAVKAYIKAPLAWQRLKTDERITFHFSPDQFLAHASGQGNTFVPFWRMKAGKAPWLHEANHELLTTAKEGQSSYPQATEENPVWLSEGAAEFLALRVSTDQKIAKFDLFKGGTVQQIDRRCLDLLKSPQGGYILSYIGSPGFISELAGPERMAYAPTFYICSCSFNKYLVTQYGIASLMEVVGAYPQERQKLKEITRLSPDVLRQKWLSAINVPERPSGTKPMQQDSLDRMLKAANLEASKIPVAVWFRQTMEKQGLDAAIKNVRSAWKSKDAQYRYSEVYLNTVGYELLKSKKAKQAIAVLELNAEMYPNSSHAYDSLAEAYLKDGQPEPARKYYTKSLELDPNNEDAKAILKNMGK